MNLFYPAPIGIHLLPSAYITEYSLNMLLWQPLWRQLFWLHTELLHVKAPQLRQDINELICWIASNILKLHKWLRKLCWSRSSSVMSRLSTNTSDEETDWSVSRHHTWKLFYELHPDEDRDTGLSCSSPPWKATLHLYRQVKNGACHDGNTHTTFTYKHKHTLHVHTF